MSTLPKVTDLTEDQLNLIIAEHIGWKFAPCIHPEGFIDIINPSGQTIGTCSDVVSWIGLIHARGLPRYAQSLDAMAEAENCQFDTHEFERIINGLGPNRALFATARQRARAFVVTIGRATL